MPVIAYKTMQLDAVWVQPRKITCGHCHRAFIYLAIGNRSVSTAGVPLISSDDSMRDRVGKQLEKALAGLAARRNQGEATCPHCRRYQSWMVSRSRNKAVGWGVGIGAIAAGLGGGVVGFVMENPLFPAFALAGAVAGGVLGAVIGSKRALEVGPHAGEDSRAMTTEEFEKHLEACEAEEYQPALAWYAMLGGEFPEKVAVVPLSLYEASGPSRIG